MPKVFKRVGSKNYYYRVSVDGRDRWINTWTDNKKLAQAEADKHAQAVAGRLLPAQMTAGLLAHLAKLPDTERTRTRRDILTALGARDIAEADIPELVATIDARLQGMPEDRQLRERASACAALAATGSRTLPMDNAWQSFADAPKGRNISQGQLTNYQTAWNRFHEWAKEHGVTSLSQVNRNHVSEYTVHLNSLGVSPRTFNGHCILLRKIFQILAVPAGIDPANNPWSSAVLFTGVKKTQRHREAFTDQELKKIAGAAHGELAVLIAIGLYTALRLKDAVLLKWEHIGSDRVKTTPSKTRHSSGAVVEIALHPGLKTALLQHAGGQERTGYVMPELARQYLRERSYVTMRFQKFLNELGIMTKEEIESQRIRRPVVKGYHSLRYTFLQRGREAGVAMSTLGAIAGHTSEDMTSNYAPPTLADKKRAVLSLPDLSFDPTPEEPKA